MAGRMGREPVTAGMNETGRRTPSALRRITGMLVVAALVACAPSVALGKNDKNGGAPPAQATKTAGGPAPGQAKKAASRQPPGQARKAARAQTRQAVTTRPRGQARK